MNKTLLETTRCMLSQAGLSKNFWDKLVNMAYYLVNRSPSIILELKIHMSYGLVSLNDYSKLSVFDCFTYAYVKEDKLGMRARKCIFLDYAFRVKGYWLWNVDPSYLSLLLAWMRFLISLICFVRKMSCLVLMLRWTKVLISW